MYSIQERIDITTDNAPLFTFGQLLRIKREAKQLSVMQAQREMQCGTALSQWERGLYRPRPEMLEKLVRFYKITEDELKACKGGFEPQRRRKYTKHKKFPTMQKEPTVKPIIMETKIGRIESTLLVLDDLIADIGKMVETGILAQTIKNDSLDHVQKARALLADVVIIDKVV